MQNKAFQIFNIKFSFSSCPSVLNADNGEKNSRHCFMLNMEGHIFFLQVGNIDMPTILTGYIHTKVDPNKQWNFEFGQHFCKLYFK